MRAGFAPDRVSAGGARLARALLAGAEAAGCAAVLLGTRNHSWNSATFAGARHRVRLALADTAPARDWAAALPEAEFRLPGQLVADLAVRRSGAEVEVEALVLDEG